MAQNPRKILRMNAPYCQKTPSRTALVFVTQEEADRVEKSIRRSALINLDGWLALTFHGGDKQAIRRSVRIEHISNFLSARLRQLRRRGRLATEQEWYLLCNAALKLRSSARKQRSVLKLAVPKSKRQLVA